MSTVLSSPLCLQPVILSGGSGTRLWPLSREHYPKQLLQLLSEHTLLQETALRLQQFHGELPLADDNIVVCNEQYRFITAEQLRQCGQPQAQIILEPVGRNTAPALTLAALQITLHSQNRDAVLLVMPADHVILDTPAFYRSINHGLKAALSGGIITFGIVPDRPETGYGYLRAGQQTAKNGDAMALDAFVEKPDAQTAQEYVQSGQYLWNSGIFMLKASVWLKAIAHFAPEISDACRKAYTAASHDHDFIRVPADAFTCCPSDSIDYAVMEKLTADAETGIRPYVIPTEAQWSDIGAWDALWTLSDKDREGNAAQGDVVFEHSRNTLVHATSRLVTCLGTDNMVIVETPDAILVASREQTQNVKKLVERLKKANYPQTQVHRKVYRPWGCYDSIDAGDRFQVKRIIVNPGASLSLQMHHHRAEHWVVVRGTARVHRGEEEFLLTENQSTYIPLGVTHRLSNPGMVPLEIIEIQSGSYLGEDDIVRFEDNYGRNTSGA